MSDIQTAPVPQSAPEPGTVTNQVLADAADAATQAANIAQAQAHNDAAGKAAAESAFVQSLMAIGEEEVIAFVGRMVKYEAKHGFGLEAIMHAVTSRIGGIF